MSFKSLSNRPQTLKERDALIKTMKAQNQMNNLRRIRKSFKNNKIILEKGDIVIILENKLGSW